MTAIDPSVTIPPTSTVWQFATILEGTKIGKHCVIGSCAWVGRNCVLGNNVRVQHGAFIPNGTKIGNNVFIGPNATLTDDRYPQAGNPDYIPEPPILEADCSIGAGAVILPGVRIGKGALIGAGAVVTSDVAACSVVVGSPARELAHNLEEVS